MMGGPAFSCGQVILTMTREKPNSEHRPFTELQGLLWRQGQDVAEVLDGVPLLRGSQRKNIEGKK